MSDKKETLYQALFAVQQAAPFVDKATANPFFKSKYADLPTVWKAVKDLMGEHGLFVSHTTFTDELGEYIRTRIIHAESGDYIESVNKIILGKSTAQEYGSYMTYMRRYALSAMLGLVTDEDDDGNAASQKKAETKSNVKPFTGEEFTTLQNEIKGCKTLDDLNVCKDKAAAAKPRMTNDQMKTLGKGITEVQKRIEILEDDLPEFGGKDE